MAEQYIPGTSRRGGAHRLPAPPSALRGRVAVLAMAAGAAGAASVAGSVTTQEVREVKVDDVALAAGSGTLKAPELVLETAPPVQLVDSDQLQVAIRADEDRAARDLAARRPLISLPAIGILTSGFEMRWGTFHSGIDIANAIGTPILAVADGEVIDAGPASGFGQWVRVRHNDGAVSLYGHVETIDVQVGQRVHAGQKIAGMGNRGFSTGPHLHFEIMPDGVNKVDPVAWLASFGIRLR